MGIINLFREAICSCSEDLYIAQVLVDRSNNKNRDKTYNSLCNHKLSWPPFIGRIPIVSFQQQFFLFCSSLICSTTLLHTSWGARCVGCVGYEGVCVDVSLFTRYDWFRGTTIENTSTLSRRAMTWNKYNYIP